jgi:hypothetical protein
VSTYVTDQLWIDGTEPPPEPKDPAIDEALDAWLEAKNEQKNSAAATKIRHATLCTRITEAGIERYPYIDRTTGKKRYVYPDTTPKLKTSPAPRPRKEKRPKRGPDKGWAENVEVVILPDEKVEKRKVSRASVEKEIDPFASMRAAMSSSRPRPKKAKPAKKGRRR